MTPQPPAPVGGTKIKDRYRVLVCGGRNYADAPKVWAILDSIHEEHGITSVFHGAATGADEYAGRWANEHGIHCIPVPADWEQYGRAAGPMRNRQMLAWDPDLVIAFPGGSGTAHMIALAKRVGLPVMEIAA
jgi:YspA, cpYpsA-related SLOG family